MTQRVYLPGTLSDITQPGPLAPRCGYTVTLELRAANREEDEEGLEYLAYLDAVAADLAVIAAHPQAPSRRVVFAADLDEAAITIESVTRVHVPATDWNTIVSMHVDDPAAQADVAAAIAGNVAALDRLDDIALSWYDATERDLFCVDGPAPADGRH